MTNKNAFTLAEVLITLGIIGVVAALTIPTLVANYQTKSWATASKVFEAKFTEALKTMNVQGQLGKYGKYTTTEGFVEELQKHFKIAKVCDNDHLMQCFGKTITMGGEEVDMSTIKLASDFGQDGWGTNILGLQFANGVTGLLAYNPKCTSDPHNNQISGSDCFAMVYDTSGFSEPNESGKDFRTFGLVNGVGNACIVKFNDICITRTAFVVTPLPYEETNAVYESFGLTDTIIQQPRGFYAAAVKQCGGEDKLLSDSQAQQIMEYIYDTTVDDDRGRRYVVRNDAKVSEFGIDFNILQGNGTTAARVITQGGLNTGQSVRGIVLQPKIKEGNSLVGHAVGAMPGMQGPPQAMCVR